MIFFRKSRGDYADNSGIPNGITGNDNMRFANFFLFQCLYCRFFNIGAHFLPFGIFGIELFNQTFKHKIIVRRKQNHGARSVSESSERVYSRNYAKSYYSFVDRFGIIQRRKHLFDSPNAS